MPTLKVWSSGSGHESPLTTGILKRRFPLLSGTTWRNTGSSTWNGSRFEHNIRLQTLTFTGYYLKWFVIIVIKADLSGVVVTMHSGLYKQFFQSQRIDNRRRDPSVFPISRFHDLLAKSINIYWYQIVILSLKYVQITPVMNESATNEKSMNTIARKIHQQMYNNFVCCHAPFIILYYFRASMCILKSHRVIL